MSPAGIASPSATASANYLDSGRAPAVGRWQHVAATYDGTTARFYIDGDEVASKVFTGNVGNSNAWRIGAYGSTPNGFFDGSVDDVRIYDRALSASEIAAGMATRIQPDLAPPTVTSSTPANDATEVSVGDPLTATFSEPMNAGDDHGGRLRAQGCGGQPRAGERLLRRGDAALPRSPSGRAGVRRPSTRRRSRAARRHGPCRERVDGRRHLVVHDPGFTAADAGRALAGESVRRRI